MNWTLHYQRDATVFWPYGEVSLRVTPVQIRPNYYAEKRRKVIWIVSRCFTLYAHREHYVAEVRTKLRNIVRGTGMETTPTRPNFQVSKSIIIIHKL